MLPEGFFHSLYRYNINHNYNFYHIWQSCSLWSYISCLTMLWNLTVLLARPFFKCTLFQTGLISTFLPLTRILNVIYWLCVSNVGPAAVLRWLWQRIPHVLPEASDDRAARRYGVYAPKFYYTSAGWHYICVVCCICDRGYKQRLYMERSEEGD